MSITYKKDITSYRPYSLPRLPEGSGTIKCLERYEGEVCYVGKVVKTWTSNDRVMSDVWETRRWVAVAEDDGTFTDKCLGCVDYNGKYLTADYTVDASPELIAKYEAEKKREADERNARQAKRLKDQADAEARYRVLEVCKGDDVVVYKGRKVPKGTKGVCIWIGSNQWGYRCGVKDAEGKVWWTALDNVKKANEDAIIKDAEACGGFAAYEAKIDCLTFKGTEVKVKGNGAGKVFWVAPNGKRVGVITKDGDKIWANASELAPAA